MPTETKAAATVSTVVANIKVIARDALRGKLISARLAKVASLEGNLKCANETLAETNVDMAVAKYDLAHIDTAHPRAKQQTDAKNELIDAITKEIEAQSKEIVTIQDLIKEQNEGIAKIESGETKVSADDLADLTAKLIEENAKKAVLALG